MVYTFQLESVTEGSQGRTSSRGMDRNHECVWGQGEAAHWLFLWLLFSSHFIIQARPARLGMALPLVGWAQSHQ